MLIGGRGSINAPRGQEYLNGQFRLSCRASEHLRNGEFEEKRTRLLDDQDRIEVLIVRRCRARALRVSSLNGTSLNGLLPSGLRWSRKTELQDALTRPRHPSRMLKQRRLRWGSDDRGGQAVRKRVAARCPAMREELYNRKGITVRIASRFASKAGATR
jgi:hypothetical protein